MAEQTKRPPVAAIIRDCAAVIGAGLLCYGAWLVYEPAGFIVGGVLLLAGAVAGALRGG